MPEVHADPDRGRAVAAGCVSIFALPFLIAGVSIIRQAIGELRHRSSDGIVLLVMGILFTVIAVGMALAAFFAIRHSMGRSRLREQSPMQPWLWRDDWAARRIVETSTHLAPALWVFALVWNAITIPLVIALLRLMLFKPVLAVVVVVLPIIGLTILCGALYVSMRSWKFGKSVCMIDALPIPVGGSFHGEIAHRESSVPESGYRLELRAVNRITTGSGQNRHMVETTLWQSELRVSPALVAPSPAGVRVPFDFDIPPDAPQSDLHDPTDLTMWRLIASAEMPGIDYNARFELPVFETTEGHAAEAVSAYHVAHRAEAAQRELGAESLVTVTPMPNGGTEFRIAPAREVGAIVTIVVILAIWFGAIAMMVRSGVPIVFAIVFVLFGLLFLVMLIDALVGRSIVVVDRQRLRAERTWLGFASTTDLDPAKIDSIRAKPGARSGRRQYFDIEARLTSGSSQMLARYLRSNADADALAAKIWFAMGRR